MSILHEASSSAKIPIVRWGIAGAGDIANRVMAPAMRAAPHAELVAVARRDQAAAEDFAATHGAQRAYCSIEALAADPDIDAIYVATPVARHYPDTLIAAAHGKHVLCEKPMALSVAEAERMRDACAKAGVYLVPCFYQRFNARHQQIRNLLTEGAIGRITAVRINFSGRVPDQPRGWRQDPAVSGGGCYMDTGSHCIDLLRFLCGEIVGATAYVDTLAAAYPVEDTVTSLLRLASGAHAVITTYWSIDDAEPQRRSMLEILGTQGVITSAPLHDKQSGGTLSITTRAGTQSYIYQQSTHVALLESFATALGAGQSPSPTAADGIAVQRVIAAVYEAGRTGTVVPITHDSKP